MPTSSPTHPTDHVVHDQVQEILDLARAAYIQHDYTGAEQLDKDALEMARKTGCRAGEVRALRYLGLCAYRLGRAPESVSLLDKSLAAAKKLAWVSEELLVCNHLGASLRKVGELQRAHDVLSSALDVAHGTRFLSTRARLLGSTGALFDDLGDIDSAADCYGRYQELLWLTDDVSRQANAAGLNSRVQRLRKRYEDALKSARQERDLGERAGDAVRVSRGARHEAEVLTELGQHAKAKAALDLAEQLLGAGGDARHLIRLIGARAQAALKTDELLEADAHTQKAWLTLQDAGLNNELELVARLAQVSAEVSSAAGLHGEALWHLGTALDAHLKRFESISSDSLRKLTAGRRRGLCDLARRLLAEEGSVGRAADEIERVRSLVDRLTNYDEKRPEPKQPPMDMKRWRAKLETTSRRRWRATLGPCIDELGDGTRKDLVLVDVLGHGPVHDLPRSLFLLMTAVERELYQRVFQPLGERVPAGALPERARRQFRANEAHPSMGGMQHILVAKPIPAVLEQLSDGAWDRLQRLGEQLATAPGTLDGGVAQSPMKLRNAIAHGRATDLSRLQADGIRRALSLGSDAPLRVLGSASLMRT